MSSFNPGAGSLSSTNLPAAFLEIAALLQIAESSIVNDAPNNVTLTSDIDGGSFAVAITIPITTSVDGSGQPVIVATDYVTNAGGSGALDTTGSSLSSITIPAALMEISQLLHNAEKAAAEPQPDNIQISYNLENLTADINATIPQSIAVTNGTIVVTATDYV